MAFRRSRPMVIELVGLAGTGKTTLLRAVGAHEPSVRAGVQVDRVRDLPVALGHGVRLAPLLLGAFGSGVHAAWSAARYMVRLNTLLTITTRSDPQGPTLLLDEGPTFILTRLAAFPEQHVGGPVFNMAWERGLRRTSGILDAIVWLDAPNAVLAQRIRHREKAHRIKGASDSELRAFLDRYRSTYDRVVDLIASSGATRVLRYDTSRRSPERLVHDITGAIRRLNG